MCLVGEPDNCGQCLLCVVTGCDSGMYGDNVYMYRKLKSRSCSELRVLLNYKQGHNCMVKNPSDYVRAGTF